MSSLREIKDRIGSVRSTLKITSAMKLVASAKLHKAQQAVEALRPYEETLSSILADVRAAAPGSSAPGPSALGTSALIPGSDREFPASHAENGVNSGTAGGFSASHAENGVNSGTARSHSRTEAPGRVAIVAVAGNSSLCGAFNINVFKRVMAEISSCGAPVDVFPIGRRIADPLRKAGYPSGHSSLSDLNDLVAHPSYGQAGALAQTLIDAYNSGVYSRVVLIYNHFVTTSRQEVVAETYLPFQLYCGPGHSSSAPAPSSSAPGHSSSAPCHSERSEESAPDYILEPSAATIADQLLPQVMRLKIYAMVLDSVAAEHAARTVAMQTATDNAEDILAELTLEYNKGRQQQITSEILDIVGGSQQ